MSHYIDLDKVQIIMTSRGCGKSAFLDVLRELPKEDVAPVVHAHWIVQKKPVYISSAEYPLCKPTKLYIPDFYNCSRCGRREPYQEPYCHCGAKMDEDDKIPMEYFENGGK